MKKKQGFVQGALILAAASLIVKIIGAVYKIPLRRFILDAEGIGLYNSSYTIYNVLFIIATAGIPVAISKIIYLESIFFLHCLHCPLLKM